MSDPTIFSTRAEYSQMRLDQLRRRISTALSDIDFSRLAIFSAGSYARLEASKYSDIDLFFIYHGEPATQDLTHTRELRMFGRLIEILDELDFPPFSNDAKYLDTAYSEDILKHLGSRQDDADNYFTLRMLMILESKPLFGEDHYKSILADFIKSYYRDYPDHQATFQPIFLVNDIARFWKTLLLNYENKRNQPERDEAVKIAEKTRNFKLKFSRMTTCFATVAAIGVKAQQDPPIEESDLLEIVGLTPRERLEGVSRAKPEVAGHVADVLTEYAWFLEHTELPTVDLHRKFADKEMRSTMFTRANAFGSKMYALLTAIDDNRSGLESRFVRYLVI